MCKYVHVVYLQYYYSNIKRKVTLYAIRTEITFPVLCANISEKCWHIQNLHDMIVHIIDIYNAMKPSILQCTVFNGVLLRKIMCLWLRIAIRKKTNVHRSMTFQGLKAAHTKISLLGCCNMQSDRNWLMFQRCLLPLTPSWWWRQ
jgi:hypothetical protein